jgi:hypothetical protein
VDSYDYTGNFYRVWVKINVHRPMKNAVSLVRDKQRQIYRVKYERLPDWCAMCGHLGHVFKEHGDEIHPKSALVFKDLRVTWTMRSGRGPGGNRGRRGRRGGRTGGNRSAGNEDSGAYGSDEDEDPDAEKEDISMDDLSRKRGVCSDLGDNSQENAGQ